MPTFLIDSGNLVIHLHQPVEHFSASNFWSTNWGLLSSKGLQIANTQFTKGQKMLLIFCWMFPIIFIKLLRTAHPTSPHLVSSPTNDTKWPLYPPTAVHRTVVFTDAQHRALLCSVTHNMEQNAEFKKIKS